MEINITKFFDAAAPMDYSASVAEIGANAGPDTWRAACDDAPDYAELLDTDEKKHAFVSHVRGMGFGEHPSELDAWSLTELTALFIQLIAGDMREAGFDTDQSDDQWKRYEADENNRGSLYRDAVDHEIYYYLGS